VTDCRTTAAGETTHKSNQSNQSYLLKYIT